MQNRISKLLNIKLPIIQAGMVWCSGWRLAAAVSNAGGLGLIGSGSMNPEVLKEHIIKCKKATNRTFGVNLPLLYPEVEKHIRVVLDEGVKVVFTSAGNPATWTSTFKSNGIRVVHVVSSLKFAMKSEEAGVDAVVAEGFEAGGHNGREETTTLCLVPQIVQHVDLPVIAAGGIANGRSMLAVMALGAEGVQIGSRFVASNESSAHPRFKEKILNLKEGETVLSLKKIGPVRLIKNEFFRKVEDAENQGADLSTLLSLLGKNRARMGMFEGDLDDGELEIGQVSSMIDEINPAGDILREIWEDYVKARKEMCDSDYAS